jgi:hypothetical protein
VAAPGVVFPVSLPSRKDQTMPAHVYREVRHTVNGPPLPKPLPRNRLYVAFLWRCAARNRTTMPALLLC